MMELEPRLPRAALVDSCIYQSFLLYGTAVEVISCPGLHHPRTLRHFGLLVIVWVNLLERPLASE